jgi:hypothetical protein
MRQEAKIGAFPPGKRDIETDLRAAPARVTRRTHIGRFD